MYYITLDVYITHIYISIHLRNTRGCSVACANGLSMVVSHMIALVSGMFQRIVTFPVDVHCNYPMNVQWHVPMKLHFTIIIVIIIVVNIIIISSIIAIIVSFIMSMTIVMVHVVISGL